MSRRFRRKKVICPTCKQRELTYTDQVICGTCQQDLERGAYLRRTSSYDSDNKDTEPFIIGDRFLRFENIPDNMKFSNQLYFERDVCDNASILSVILDVVGNPYNTINAMPKNYKHALFCKNEYNNWNRASYAKPNQILALGRLVNFILWLGWSRYQEGYKKGRRLLAGLQDGSISISEFDETMRKANE